MKDVLLLEKQVGETPLECMDRFRAAHAEYANVKMTYAGRLDPMASGLLVVLTGEAVHRKNDFSGMDKEYECTAILGVATDTYDILGKIQEPSTPPSQNATDGRGKIQTEHSKNVVYEGEKNALARSKAGFAETEQIERILQSFVGTFEQSYPPYSSKTINGVQMHTLAREGKLNGVEMPKRMVTVYEVSEVITAAATRAETAADIIEHIEKVTGDFRQEETITAWNEWRCHEGDIQTISFKIRVSSGTYIRGIVHELGKRLGTGTCIWKLHRTKIGDFTLENKDF